MVLCPSCRLQLVCAHCGWRPSPSRLNGRALIGPGDVSGLSAEIVDRISDDSVTTHTKAFWAEQLAQRIAERVEGIVEDWQADSFREGE